MGQANLDLRMVIKPVMENLHSKQQHPDFIKLLHMYSPVFTEALRLLRAVICGGEACLVLPKEVADGGTSRALNRS